MKNGGDFAIKTKGFIEMQKVKHISDKYMKDLERHLQEFIIEHNADVKNMSMTFNSITKAYHAIIIYEDK